ncbi:sulfate reduction electron transfer complex DsrMKJOP subunit DsrP [Sorangium sp. So ce315]|uniref:sulfate reduction electron transfer complex DsrMKJOP subunit DsrP n=1 Tax=Sorangium sp. So ce315 TaxID=3133299 RepID=UPI003F5F0753
MRKDTHAITYPRFLLRVIGHSFEGSWRFYVWMTVLTAIALVGANAWAHQLAEGMRVTGMSDHVSWGLYIANFTFGVGLAAGAVMMVIPAYLYDDHEMHDVVILGELLAIAAIVVCLLFIVADMGRPDRFWHILPGIGRFNWPISMLTWDVIVLNGYLFINLHISGYLIYTRYLGKKPDRRWYLPFVFLSIGWAVSIHTVTAFLYSGLGGRPFWNSALLAPRFIASAFITGPAFVILLLQLVARLTRFRVGDGPIRTLTSVLRVTVLLNLFMLGSELFTSLYTGGAHGAAVSYLFFGLHGKGALVPWIWSAVALNVASAVILHLPASRRSRVWLDAACVAAFAGVWIEKGMGLIIPGFVPSTLHELVEYVPSMAEWKITAGIWAAGLMVLTVAIKVALTVLTGELSAGPRGDAGSAEKAAEPVAAE